MIRSLVLELKSDYRVYTRTTNVSYTRDNIWRDWSISLFNDDRDSIYGWGSNHLGFPQLEKLTLDFTEWQLTENDGVLVLLLDPPDMVFLYLCLTGQTLYQKAQTK